MDGGGNDRRMGAGDADGPQFTLSASLAPVYLIIIMEFQRDPLTLLVKNLKIYCIPRYRDYSTAEIDCVFF